MTSFVFTIKDIRFFTGYCVGCGIFAGVGVYKGDMAMVRGGFLYLFIILIAHVVLKTIIYSSHIHTYTEKNLKKSKKNKKK